MQTLLEYFKNTIKLVLLLFFLVGFQENTTKNMVQGIPDNSGVKTFNNITLEASLKPFKQKDNKYYKEVAYTMYSQWASLLKHTDTVSIMLWTADGSEILDHEVGSGPKSLSLHERAYVYMEDAPEFTYGDLHEIIQTLRDVGEQITNKTIRIGATFDPGPEFAKSPFKYEKHPEIVQGSAMGGNTFVNSYAVLKGDTTSYAGYPNGIPDNTPFGSFFGRQSQHFLTDLGFDYLWLSNGFGFGMEPWHSAGAIFTGKGFETDKLADTKKKIIDFWSLFREECPDFRIETRGTNIATGIDLAKDGVDLRSIYHGDFNLLPPPNSPWAALDGDFGLELMGYMTRIADIPDNRYLFRYYTHDPWWLNSPWLDRYGREPHDIYLPMSISRIDGNGVVALPTHLNFLTIDDSLGDMPDKVPNEVIPHILTARNDSPTAPGPLVWVYPFDEYHDWADAQQERVSEMYFGDWFIRQAINSGLPLNTVISTKNILSAITKKPTLFKGPVLFSIVPDAGSKMEIFWTDYLKNGGKVVFYGPVQKASSQFLEILNLQNTTPLEGEFKVERKYILDDLDNPFPDKILHSSLLSGGGIESKVGNNADSSTEILATFIQGNERRDVMWTRTDPKWAGGKVAYVRGTNSAHYTGGRLLKPDNPNEYFIGPKMLRDVLMEFGISIKIEKVGPEIQDPKTTIARSDNGYFFSGYNPNTTVVQKFRFEQGAPLMLGYDTKLEKGHATYSFPPSWHRECRVFVEQEEGVLSSSELTPVQYGIKRRLEVSGLKNANVRIYVPEGIGSESIYFYNNPKNAWKEGQIEAEKVVDSMGTYYLARNITGQLVVAWE